VRQLIAIRLQPEPYQGYPEDPTLNQIFARLYIKFHGVRLNELDWGDEDHSLSISIRDPEGGLLFHLIFNAYWESLEFELPPLEAEEHQGWYRWLDTNLGAPYDICPWSEALEVSGPTYLAQPRSVVGLIAR
jgi:glycogen operon protein